MHRRIPVAQPCFLGNEARYVAECVESGWISSAGSFIERFEEMFAESCGVEHALACSSGTAALHLALKALGVGRGDEVLVPTLTFIATANAVTYCEATPVFVDCCEGSMNIDPDDVERKITPRTRGVIPVHLYGWPAEMDVIREIASRHGLFVLEDAAEALGARYQGRQAGGLGDIASFSFYGNKIITTGEGGMVVADSEEVIQEARLLRGQGMDPRRRYWFDRIGFNYRMTNLQAAVGLAQLECLEQHLEARRQVARTYQLLLDRAQEFLDLPMPPAQVEHAYWMYTVLLRPDLDRDQVAASMEQEGVETRPVFHPLHAMPPYRKGGSRFPVAESLSVRGLTLPTFAGLTEEDLDRVVQALYRACAAQVAGGRG